MTEQAKRLAQGWIEATTDRDFAEIPAELQADLVRCARDFLAYAQPRIVAGRVLS